MIDLKRFKKVAVSSDHSLLMDNKENEIKISHKHLSPELLKQLQSLPIHKAGGGDTEDPQDDSQGPIPGVDTDVTPQANSSQDPALAGSPQAGMQAQMMAQNNDPNAAGGASGSWGPDPTQTQSADSSTQAPDQSQAQAAPDNSASDEAQAQPKAQAQAPAPQAQPPPTPQDYSNELQQENQMYQQDLARGQIPKETYQSLFDSKSTIGKIGTLFGLLVGGAGAGLTHTANPVLSMMQQEIQNDLERQSKANINTQNFYHLSLANQMQQAQTKFMGTQGQLNQAQAQNATVEAHTKAFTLAHMYANSSMLHSMNEQVQKFAPGTPQRAQAEAALAQVSQFFNATDANLSDLAGASLYKMHFLGGYQIPGQGQNSSQPNVPVQKENGAQSGGSSQPPETESQFKNRMTGLQFMGPQGQQLANFQTERHLSGVPEVYGQQADRPIAPQDRTQFAAIQNLQTQGNNLLSYINKNTKVIQDDPAVRKTVLVKIGELEKYYDMANGGTGVPTGPAQAYANQLFGPRGKLGTAPTDFLYKVMGNPARFQEIIKGAERQKTQMLKSYGLKPQPVKTYQGKTYVRGPNGQAIQVQ